MSSLFDAEKLRRLLVLAGTKVRPKGKSMVGVVVGVWMNVYVNNSGYVEIRAGRGSLEVYVNQDEIKRRSGWLPRSVMY
ncbi:hypothetical protein [Vulcanisaeta souniana]|uniref:hypothetical protein n=1 Tax=Vulcanisaeta souniana TaxID=164452 RepID=UPI0006D1F63F|nr:hypothetical protein [Vulcanisaeta souniana]